MNLIKSPIRYLAIVHIWETFFLTNTERWAHIQLDLVFLQCTQPKIWFIFNFIVHCLSRCICFKKNQFLNVFKIFFFKSQIVGILLQPNAFLHFIKLLFELIGFIFFTLDIDAQLNFSSHWENISTLWQYLFSNFTKPYLT